MNTRTPILSNYRFLRVLGKGGMGTVYLAQHTVIQRQVAVKELHPQYSRDAQIRERFRNEAAVLAGLSHANIVQLHDYIETPEHVYLVMEYVEGMSLDEYLRQSGGGLGEARARQIFTLLLEAFAYAHAQGVIHRDIKPSNIMLTPQGNVKVLDFGIAKQLQSPPDRLTRTGMRMGTLYYMSPEQVRGQVVDTRSDIYSLGVTLWEILAGHNPYPADISEFDLANMVVQKELPSLRNEYPSLSQALDVFIRKATAKAVGERFQTVAEMLAAFQDVERWAQRILSPQAENPNEIVLPHTRDTLSQHPVVRPSVSPPTAHPEQILLENTFGRVGTRSLTYWQGRDLFEQGRCEELPLRRISHVELHTHREIPTGIFFLLITLPLLIYYFSLFTLLLSLGLMGFAGICFLKFPTITLQKTNGKKIKMRGWAWHNRAASEYVLGALEALSTHPHKPAN